MLLQATAPTCSLVPTSEADTQPSWYSTCPINYTRDTWVKLLQLPSYFAYDQALLLCQADGDLWAAWVPDHGEVLLDKSYFYC